MFSLLATTTLTAFFSIPVAHAQELPPQPEPAPIVRQFCSCVAYVREFIPTMPHLDAAYFAGFPRTTPAPGRVAILRYGDVFHVVYVQSVKDEGFVALEANFRPCERGKRLIEWADPHLVGFWAPSS